LSGRVGTKITLVHESGEDRRYFKCKKNPKTPLKNRTNDNTDAASADKAKNIQKCLLLKKTQ